MTLGALLGQVRPDAKFPAMLASVLGTVLENYLGREGAAGFRAMHQT